MAQIFISYSSKDEAKALDIVNALEKQGLSCWIACRDIPVGGSFAREIPPAIRQCPVFMLLLSKNSVQSDDVLNELSLAKRKYEQKKLIVPMKLEDFILPDDFDYHLANVQIRDYFKEPQGAMAEAVLRIREHISEQTTVSMKQQIVDQTITRIAMQKYKALAEKKKVQAEESFRQGKALEDAGDYAQAAVRFQEAADGGHIEAKAKLGGLYFTGKGVPANREKGMALYREAAEHGSTDAQLFMGVFHENGIGVPQDRDAARAWYQKGVDQGSLSCKVLLKSLNDEEK